MENYTVTLVMTACFVYWPVCYYLESLLCVAPDVTLLDPFLGPIPGTLYITNYKIYFRASPSEKSEVFTSIHQHIVYVVIGGFYCGQPSEPTFSLEVPLGTIQRVEKIGRSRSRGENAYGLEICCKVCTHACSP